MTSAVATDEERLPLGVSRRSGTGKLIFSLRVPGGNDQKFYTTKIRTAEEGGLCNDIARLYFDALGAPGSERGKRQVPSDLNYPEYSVLLVLEELPRDFDILRNMEWTKELILKQAQAAVKGLPKHLQPAAKSGAKVKKHSAQDVGSQRIDDRSLSYQNAHGSLPLGGKDHEDLAGVHRNIDVRKFFKDIREHSDQCRTAYASKVSEREALERTVNGIKEDMGIIRLPECGRDDFHQPLARLKNPFVRDAESFETCEQAYKSEESKCWKLRKIVEDHNGKLILESLTRDGNTMTGRLRAHETERLPSVLEGVCNSQTPDDWFDSLFVTNEPDNPT